MRKNGKYSEVHHERDHQEIVDAINALQSGSGGSSSTGILTVNVLLPLTEYAVPHDLGVVPTNFYHVVTPTSTTSFNLFPGPTAWTTTNIYVQSNINGVFNIVIRK